MNVTIPTAADTAVLFLDLQDEIIKNNRTCQGLEVHADALAKLAALHQLPAIASSVPPGGPYMRGIRAALPGVTPMARMVTSAFADEATASAIEACGRKSRISSATAAKR